MGSEMCIRDSSEIDQRFEKLTELLIQPETVADQQQFRTLSREHSELQEIVTAYRQYQKISQSLEENQLIADDASEDTELRDLAREEIQELEVQSKDLTQQLELLLLPKDPDDTRNTILEIRAGTGGDEAALFASDLFRMYARFAESQQWKLEILNESSTDIGGFKEVILSVSGKKVYSKLKFEGGVHRVQRIPKTETQGRVHTSAATVAVLPEVEDLEVEVNPNDIRVDVFRSSGPGGQSVNTTDSAVRITHISSGLVVTCQNEKSQLKNKNQALKVLRARLYEKELQEQQDTAASQRNGIVGRRDRSVRKRYYNFPQFRITDHRINLTLYKLEDIMMGNLDQVIEPLLTHHQAELLKAS